MVKRSARVAVFSDDDPPLPVGACLVAASLRRYPARIFIAGRSGAGKSSVASVIAGTHPGLTADKRWELLPAIPVCNHADGIKDEVLEWVAIARKRGLTPGERSTFVAFCDFLGISQAIVERDLWEILRDTWDAMNELLETAYSEPIPVQQWAGVPSGIDVPGKVAFVDRHGNAFRRSLQLYGESIRQISGSEEFWAERTVDRGFAFRACLNADTRFTAEAVLLRATGWIGVYLDVPDEILRERRPEMTAEALAHRSEHGIGPGDCDIAVDGGRPLGRVVLDIAEWLSARSRAAAVATGE